MADVAGEFIRPNDRLTSLERLSIYNRQYWFRLNDCLWDDYPGLRAILGVRRFKRLGIEYLKRHPSTSFTLRNLGQHLESFIASHPHLTGARQPMALDMARFEWAQVVAFDGEEKQPLNVDDLLGKDPAKLRLALQPYLSLLQLDYPLDDFVLAVKKRDRALRAEASNAVQADRAEKKPRPVRLPRRQRIWLAVHRHDFDLYYKRLAEPEYKILASLSVGRTLAEACAAAIDEKSEFSEEIASQLSSWFESWARIGWFCRR